jgi:DNA mismatch repair protein MutH
MTKLPYDLEDAKSIIEFAKLLIGKSVMTEFANDIPQLNLNEKDKGRLGKVIEELHFRYKQNSNPSADFKKAGLELKSAGLKKLAKNKGFNAKERLVLNIINFEEAINLDFDEDFLTGKNAHLLLVFYLYEQGLSILESIIKIVGDWKYSDEDIEIIRKDYEKIKEKIKAGKAHELSEGDTFYLGACTKGANANTMRTQPFSSIPAKQRAYSLKPGYVNHIIASIANDKSDIYGKLIPSVSIAKKLTIEEIILDRFRPLINKKDSELVSQFSIEHINPKVKDYHSRLSRAIVNSVLDVPKNMKVEDYIEEFRKAEITVKTVRLKENNLPKEDVSLPVFTYEELVNSDWEGSEFYNFLNNKFLFIFFQFQCNELILRKVRFWNMSNSDMEEVQKVWIETRDIVSNGNIVREVKNGKRGTNFPNKKFNHISHVRPHANNSADTLPLPTRDKVTQAMEYTKHSFWLNNTYVRDEIYLKD